ncbi:MAG: hypothetical protein KGM24_10805, partial [Elusimicrobia bacterium]|nr:hypothetical protein [Elusimicrobiota bacterium]
KAPASPAAAASAAAAAAVAEGAADVDALLDTASLKLFGHVADLMKELENRREEKALTLSLQRQLAVAKDELAAARERADALELRLPRIAELEEAQRRGEAELKSLRSGLQAREQSFNEARGSLERLRNELEGTRRRLVETAGDLALRNKLVDKLSKELGDKELSLAKSLGVIRRLEEDLARLCPDRPAQGSAAQAAPPPPQAPVPAAPLEAPPEEEAPEKLESLTIPPAPEAAPEAPRAQQALSRFMKKIFPDLPH